jgi:toxin FitB
VILLDTNVLSELMKALPEAAVERWFLMNEEESHIPSIAIGELAFGVAKLEASLRKSKLEAQISEWRIRFAERTYAYDVQAALAYGEILANARSAGRPMSVPDAQIAAIAKEHSCTLATRNTKDFEATGLTLVNPWH